MVNSRSSLFCFYLDREGRPMPKTSCSALRLCAAAVAALAVLGTSGGVAAAASAKHGPIHLRRNPNGTLTRGLRNQLISGNWSGYALAGYQTNSSYTSASMTWTVPTVTFGQSTDSTSSVQYSANWVGIGGFCENATCTQVDNTLIQLGTQQVVSSTGQTSYGAWYETLPSPENAINTRKYPVMPGDSVTATLQCTSCSTIAGPVFAPGNGGGHSGKSGGGGGSGQSWVLTMTDNTAGWTWSKNVTYNSSLTSAEWIEEAPSSSGGILPLADFGTAQFQGANQANGALASLDLSTNGIEMADPWGQWALPSDAGGYSTFDVCYVYSPNSAPTSTCQ